MNLEEPEDDPALQTRMQYLLDLDISTELPPDQRLLLAVLRQSVVDYFGDDPLERLSAGIYFARSPVYRTTLQLFNLPDDLLPTGVDLSAFRKKENLNQAYEPNPLRLESLVRQLSGTQLKIVLTMGLVALPAPTRTISLNCGMSRSTVLVALDSMAAQGLVLRHDDDIRPRWSLPATVRAVLDEVWGTREG